MTRLCSPRFSALFAPLLLVGVIIFAWATIHEAWTWRAWTSPSAFHGDILEVYARVQAAAEDLAQPFLGYAHIERLAAPFGANWSGYPTPDALTFFCAGLLARVIGVAGAVYLLALGITVLNGLAFYAVGRWLRWRVEWAWTAGLLFAFSSYNFGWSVTLSLGQTFTLPPLVLLCGLAARRGGCPLLTRRWCLGAVGLGVWLGLGNPYLAFFAAQIVAGTLCLAWFRRVPRTRWIPLALTLGSLGVASLFTLLPPLYSGTATELAAPVLDRNFAGTEIYGFRPVDVLIPPADHRWPAWAFWGQRYKTDTVLQGEFFQNYLGLIGLAGLLGLLGQTVVRGWISRRRPSDAALGMFAVLLFAVVGGGNTLLALAGLDVFRAGGRMGIFLHVWVLLFVGAWLHRCTLRLPRAFSMGLAGVVAAFGWLDQVPATQHERARRAVAPLVENHRLLAQELAHALEPGSRVFQIPAVPFPEAGTLLELGDYEHFRPFLSGDSLHYSYGMLRGSGAWVWHQAVAQLPPASLIARLENAGFDALWIDQRGFPDGARAMLSQLRDLGYDELIAVPDLPIAVVRLKPAEFIVAVDTSDPALYPAWQPYESLAATPPETPLRDMGGWYPLERAGPRAWRWAGRRATLGIQLAADSPASAALTFNAASLRPGTLHLWQGETLLWSAAISPATQTHRLELPRTPRPRNLHWVFDGPVVSPSSQDRRRLGFRIEDLTLVILPPAAPPN